MKLWLAVAVALFVPACAHAQAAKSCEDLKSEIAKKIEANGVKSYSLEIAAKDANAEGKIVGTCDGGTKKLVYRRTAVTPQAAPADATKP
jgi:hypothetical protein